MGPLCVVCFTRRQAIRHVTREGLSGDRLQCLVLGMLTRMAVVMDTLDREEQKEDWEAGLWCRCNSLYQFHGEFWG